MIKKLTFALCLILSLAAFSQIDKPIKKGNMIVGGTGSINYNLINYNSDSEPPFQTKDFGIDINPNFSYFFINNLALGISNTIGLSLEKSNNGYYLGIGPIIKYYLNNGLVFKAESSYLYGHSELSKTNSVNFETGLGYAFFINSKVSIEPLFLYKFNSKKFTLFENVVFGQTIPEVEYSQKWSTFFFEVGFNIFL
jgi:hypothetical protein